jgi:hypothetical protein
MTQLNPYQASELPAEAAALPPGTLTLGKALRFVLLTMTIFATLGALLGLIIALVMPQYYTRLFNLTGGGEAVAAGVLLGLMQGGGIGIAVGVILSAIVGWVQLRGARRVSEGLSPR